MATLAEKKERKYWVMNERQLRQPARVSGNEGLENTGKPEIFAQNTMFRGHEKRAEQHSTETGKKINNES